MTRKLILSGTFLITVGIILGSIAAHGLKTAGLPDDKIASFEIGVRLQMYAGFGLLILASIQKHFNFTLKIPMYLLWIGTLFFSGSIYFLATKQLHGIDFGKAFALITPVGGLMMILAWAIIFLRYLLQKKA